MHQTFLSIIFSIWIQNYSQRSSLLASTLSGNSACGLFSKRLSGKCLGKKKDIPMYERVTRHRARRTKWERLSDHYFTSCSSGFWLYGLIRRDCGDGEGRWGQSNDRLTEKRTEIEGTCACTRERRRFRANAEERSRERSCSRDMWEPLGLFVHTDSFEQL